jgi:hypothetical protein
MAVTHVPMTVKFWVPNTHVIFSLAVAAAKGITAPARQGGRSEALVSIVFAAAALEAFLSETAYLAEFAEQKAPTPGVVSAFAQVMEDAEESKASIESKFHLAHLTLTGNAYDRGIAPYQDFSLLIAARNALVHFKSREYFSSAEGRPAVFNQAGVVDKLKSKSILHEPVPGAGAKGNLIIQVGDKFMASAEFGEGADNVRFRTFPDAISARWTFLISTKAVAEWACNTAAGMAVDMIEKLPKSAWKDSVETYLREAFVVPW